MVFGKMILMIQGKLSTKSVEEQGCRLGGRLGSRGSGDTAVLLAPFWVIKV